MTQSEIEKYKNIHAKKLGSQKITSAESKFYESRKTEYYFVTNEMPQCDSIADWEAEIARARTEASILYGLRNEFDAKAEAKEVECQALQKQFLKLLENK